MCVCEVFSCFFYNARLFINKGRLFSNNVRLLENKGWLLEVAAEIHCLADGKRQESRQQS
jgi:hypothetical protein